MNTQIEMLSVVGLKEPEINPNSLDLDKYATLKRAIKEHGFLQPVLVNADNTIIDGVHRVRAAKDLGIEKVPCVVQSMTANAARIVQIGMNRLRGELDLRTVSEVLVDLQGAGVDFDALTLTGFSVTEMNALLSALKVEEPLPSDVVPPTPFVEAEPEELNPKPFILELKFTSRDQLAEVKKGLKKAAGGGKAATLEAGLLSLLKGS